MLQRLSHKLNSAKFTLPHYNFSTKSLASNSNTTSAFPILQPISYKQSQVNRNAMIIENEEYESKIIFPDVKFSMNINKGKKNYSIKNMIEDSRKLFEKDMVLSVSFLEEDGTPIAGCTQADLLTRLTTFHISINGGDKIYNCINTNYLGNKQLGREIYTSGDNINFANVERLMYLENISFATAVNLSTKRHSATKNIEYLKILRHYLHSKYSNLNEYTLSLEEKRNKRIQKFTNLFFYLCLKVTISLNLCSFVFFNWDFMEPITCCITYMNIIAGYYYWALTNSDYDIDSITYYARNRKYIQLPHLVDNMINEKREIVKLLENDYARSYH